MKIVEAWRTFSTMGEENTFLVEEDAASASEYARHYEEGYAITDEYDRIYGFYETFYDAELDLCKRQGGVAIGPNYIAIYHMGDEIAYWDEQEWLEDPKLALNLANAVRMYYTKGPEFMRKMLDI